MREINVVNQLKKNPENKNPKKNFSFLSPMQFPTKKQ